MVLQLLVHSILLALSTKDVWSFCLQCEASCFFSRSSAINICLGVVLIQKIKLSASEMLLFSEHFRRRKFWRIVFLPFLSCNSRPHLVTYDFKLPYSGCPLIVEKDIILRRWSRQRLGVSNEADECKQLLEYLKGVHRPINLLALGIHC